MTGWKFGSGRLKRKMLILLYLTSALLLTFVASFPVDPRQPQALDDKFPVMVAVSSTVIPLTYLFGKPKPLQSSSGAAQKPRSSSSGSAYLSPGRRMRLLERSRRPDEPVRLITKNSRQKTLNNETH